MTANHAIVTIWAVLFLWYLAGHLRAVKGYSKAPPIWHHPIAAARDIWRKIWDTRYVGWGLIAGIVGGYTIAWLAGLDWSRVTSVGGAVSASMRQPGVLHIEPERLAHALGERGLAHSLWPDFVDAIALYPAFDLGLASGAMAATWLVVLTAWCAGNVGSLRSFEGYRRRQYAVAGVVMVVGLAALAASEAFERGSIETAAQSVLLPIVWVVGNAVARGATVGLLSLLLADVALSLPVGLGALTARWLYKLPGFVLLAAVPVTMQAIGQARFDGWQVDPGQLRGLAAAFWVIARLSWLIVLPGWLQLAFSSNAMPRIGEMTIGFWRNNAIKLAVLMVRAAVVLAPVLAAMRLLSIGAPPDGLLPGILVVCASWLVGVVTLGAVIVAYRHMARIRFGVEP